MDFVGLIWLAGFVVGHIATLAFSLNWWYGQRFPHLLLSVLRQLHGILVVAGCAGFAWAVLAGYPLGRPLSGATSWPGEVAEVYVLWCICLGLIGVPAISAYRLLRPRPKAFVESRVEMHDITRELGYKPIGRGRFRWMAKMPFNQAFQVDISSKVFQLPRLPPVWDGLTILHLTDLHFHGTPSINFHRMVLDACMSRVPDIVAITGDIIDSPRHHRWIVPLFSRLRWNIAALAILGNHDQLRSPALVRSRLHSLGIPVIQNRWMEINVRGERMIVIGHQGPWYRPAPSLQDCPEGIFRLCLSHTPDNIPWARKHGVDLMLSGHNHGGQIRFPFVGSVLVPSIYSRRYDCGVFWEEPTLLHVSRGVAGQHPLRYNCRPEATLITLKAPT